MNNPPTSQPKPNRRITDHVVNGLNECIDVQVVDEPGPGGANHLYALVLHPHAGIPAKKCVLVEFQNGPIQSPDDMNGFTTESLIAVAIDRMRGFQHQRKEDSSFDFTKPGQFACRENAIALTHLEESLMWLQKRTRDRIARGVEGRNVK